MKIFLMRQRMPGLMDNFSKGKRSRRDCTMYHRSAKRRIFYQSCDVQLPYDGRKRMKCQSLQFRMVTNLPKQNALSSNSSLKKRPPNRLLMSYLSALRRLKTIVTISPRSFISATHSLLKFALSNKDHFEVKIDIQHTVHSFYRCFHLYN